MANKSQPPRELEGFARIAVKLSTRDHVRLNVIRAQERRSLQALVREALNVWLAQHGEPPLEDLSS